MSEMKHSPLPWRVFAKNVNDGARSVIVSEHALNGGGRITTFPAVCSIHNATELNGINADFIVAACNSYYESKDLIDRLQADKAKLVEALKWIRSISDMNLEQDQKLKARGARTLKRIGDKVDEALNEAGE